MARAALAIILPIADIGLAHSGVEALADLADAIALLQLPWRDGPRTATRARSQTAIEMGGPPACARYLSSPRRPLGAPRRRAREDNGIDLATPSSTAMALAR